MVLLKSDFCCKKSVAIIGIAFCLFSLAALPALGSAGYATAYIADSSGKPVLDVVADLQKILPKVPTGNERRQLTSFLAKCYLRVSLFEKAAKAWADAAFAGEKGHRDDSCLVKAAICSLHEGNTVAASGYLNPVLMTSTDGRILADARIVAVWILVFEDHQDEAVAALESYMTTDGDMRKNRPAVLFALWYLTGSSTYSNRLQKEFSQSPEALVVSGKAQLVPGAFWYFMPRAAVAELSQQTSLETVRTVVESETESNAASVPVATTSIDALPAGSVFQQTGFYKNREYADAMVQKLKKNGFEPVIKKQKRASGTEYYAVGVYDNADGTIAPSLRNAGIECSPVFE